MMRSMLSSSALGPDSTSALAALSTATTTSGAAFVSVDAGGALVTPGFSGGIFSTMRTVPRDICG